MAAALQSGGGLIGGLSLPYRHDGGLWLSIRVQPSPPFRDQPWPLWLLFGLAAHFARQMADSGVWLLGKHPMAMLDDHDYDLELFTDAGTRI